MPFLRALLFLTAFSAAALAQTAARSPAQWSEPQRRVVMMQPIPTAARRRAAGPHPSRLRVLSAPDHDLFVRAFEAAARGDGRRRASGGQSQNVQRRRLLEWRYALDSDSGASFAEIDAAIKDTESKHQRRNLAAARHACRRAPKPPSPRHAGRHMWPGSPQDAQFQHRQDPVGRSVGGDRRKGRGGPLIRSGWAKAVSTPDRTGHPAKDAGMLTPESDRARLDNLLWRSETRAAKRQVSACRCRQRRHRQCPHCAAVRRPAQAQALVDRFKDSAIPACCSTGPRLRLADRDREAHAMLLRVPREPMVKDTAARWWQEISVQARDALARPIRAGLRPGAACRLHSGEQYAEQQFLAGFIALRFLKDANSP
jgi:soluble lytic murein transglycosylase